MNMRENPAIPPGMRKTELAVRSYMKEEGARPLIRKCFWLFFRRAG